MSDEHVFDNAANDDSLSHYGMPRRSGRYPWGSGKDPYQHSADFLARYNELKKTGMSESQIGESFGLTSGQLRIQLAAAKHERRQLQVDKAKSLRSDGKTLEEIADIMGFSNESSVRALLNDATNTNKNRAKATADTLEEMLQSYGMIDVGKGANLTLGVSTSTLDEALFLLENRGYNVYGMGIKNVTNADNQYNTTVLTQKDVKYKDVYNKIGDIRGVYEYYSTDGGTTFEKVAYPASIKSNRIKIHYGDEEMNGTKGTDKDGVIELRRGVKDLDLGNSSYAQVRILVDGTHYLKGMAMYSDDIPDGYDIVFNTNKSSGTPKNKVLKAIDTADPDNPFGAALTAQGQSYYKDGAGHKKLSAINKLREEGDWDNYSKSLSSQFLSKQPLKLIRTQLNLTYDGYEAELKEIQGISNTTIRKQYLKDFAESCDSAVVHLKAAALPRQTSKVLLPLTCIKDNEVYAPTYKNGEKVVLIRYPHGGTFEIPELTVNNTNKKARSIISPLTTDAIGITPATAAKLSGADFDGDHVVIIPVNSKTKIATRKGLKDLEGFDPKTSYATDEKVVNGKTVRVNAAGIPVKVMTKKATSRQMGMISNLITDMQLQGGASDEEIARAVKHSMVVIDAAKHKLDYKQSEKDNGIDALRKKYQPKTSDGSGGASTLISRHKQTVNIPERRGSGKINPTTGEIEYKQSGRTYIDKKTGAVKQATTKVHLLNQVSDLRALSSGTAQENAYADYGNRLKALANRARKEYIATPSAKQNKQAKAVYATEIASLQRKVTAASMNAPKERRAHAIANSVVKAKVESNPALAEDTKALKKAKQIAITNARVQAQASSKRVRFSLTDKEWEAIQAGAATSSLIQDVLRYSDEQTVKARVLPKATTNLSDAKIAKLKSMAGSGMYTNQEIANALGCSPSTVSQYLNQ